MTLTELRDALAKATGPSVELSEAIAEYLGWTDLNKNDRIGKGIVRWLTPDKLSEQRGFGPPHYTASIDAALRLIPEECGIELERYWRKQPGMWWKAALYWGTAGDYVDVKDAPAAAIALCIARCEYEIAMKSEMGAQGAEGDRSEP